MPIISASRSLSFGYRDFGLAIYLTIYLVHVAKVKLIIKFCKFSGNYFIRFVKKSQKNNTYAVTIIDILLKYVII